MKLPFGRLALLCFGWFVLLGRSEALAAFADADNAAAAATPAEPAVDTAADTNDGSTNDGNSELRLEQWSQDDWLLVKPRVALLEMDGYLRLRAQLYRRMDFSNASLWESSQDDLPIPRYPPLSDGSADFSFTNMRLRLEPVINVSEQLQIVATLDLLDNLLLGSTPDVLFFGQTLPPLNVLSRRQVVPQLARNSMSNALAVKRLWGRATALGEQLELRFGRMPDQFGLGMLYNDGDCLDCDYGSVVDRIAVSFRLYNHVFTPMLDWVSKGLQYRPFGTYDPQPIDAVTWDDTTEYALRVTREDHPADIRDATLHGSAVLNYGVSTAFRVQPRDWETAFWQTGFDPNRPPGVLANGSPATSERRDAFVFTGDVWSKYYTGNFELAAEVALQTGSFTDTVIGATTPGNVGNLAKTSIFSLGGALETRYYTRHDRQGLLLSFLGGAASGDGHFGAGALDLSDTQRGPHDYTLHNFQFSPDYHIDLLLFRRLLGSVTDAWYVRPDVAYRFDENWQGRLNILYAQAVRSRSTAIALSGGTPEAPLGVEFDAQISYGLLQSEPTSQQSGQLVARLDGGLLLPLGAFHNLSENLLSDRQGSFAWTVQTMLALTF